MVRLHNFSFDPSQGHDVTYSKLGSFFCDCGAKEDGSCKVSSKFHIGRERERETETERERDILPHVIAQALTKRGPKASSDSRTSSPMPVDGAPFAEGKHRRRRKKKKGR